MISNQRYNAYLKEIADVCGIQKKLTTHTARHTFATTVLLMNDVPMETAMELTASLDITNSATSALSIDFPSVVDSSSIFGLSLNSISYRQPVGEYLYLFDLLELLIDLLELLTILLSPDS